MIRAALLFFALIGTSGAVAAAADDLQTQSPTTTVQSFTAVEGADLMARLEAVQSRARAKQTPYSSAHSFDVRSAVLLGGAEEQRGKPQLPARDCGCHSARHVERTRRARHRFARRRARGRYAQKFHHQFPEPAHSLNVRLLAGPGRRRNGVSRITR